MTRCLAFGASAILVFGFTACQSAAPQATGNGPVPTVNPDFQVDANLAEMGREVFIVKDCRGCHSIGLGRSAGPDLFGVVERRPIDWLNRFLADTDVMLDTDPVAQALLKQHYNIRMPQVRMTDQEREALIHYIASATMDVRQVGVPQQ
ncbi:MAG: c-type cytochrome [Planctomycetaceae bacterium]